MRDTAAATGRDSRRYIEPSHRFFLKTAKKAPLSRGLCGT